MKKKLAMLFCTVLAVTSVMAGCGKQPTMDGGAAAPAPDAGTDTTAAAPAATEEAAAPAGDAFGDADDHPVYLHAG